MTIRGPVLEFSNGVKMPQVGLGTWQSTDAESKIALKAALDVGYRLIDTATVYGNEEVIRDTIQEAFANGKVRREELFITTKLWAPSNHPDDVEPALRGSLKLLQLDYVDLYLMHFPTCITSDLKGHRAEVKLEYTWKAFEKIYKKGLAKAIGVSNCSVEQIEGIMKIATVPIHNLQVEIHLYWPQHELQAVCKKYNITLTSFATLGSPGRTNFQAPGIFDWAPAPSCLEDKNVKALAEKYGKTPAQILLRYCIYRGIAVIPKSNKSKRIAENFDLFDFSLSPCEINLLETDGHRQRLFTQDFMTGHPEDPYKAERKKK